jgi:FtsZ-binding cell division protein ZapB
MTEELKENEEELRQNAEEMRATHEELERSNSKLEQQITEVENAQKRLHSLLGKCIRGNFNLRSGTEFEIY